MLALTETAAEAISNILETNEMPEGSGLRIAATPNMAEEGLELSVAPNPAADDTVLEGGGAVIFLEPVAASALDDKVLDVERVPGERGRRLRATSTASPSRRSPSCRARLGAAA